ncbi:MULTISPECIES: site-specific integrase [Aerococcus]|uniref:Site-specific integrase n=1 Tax=Aerococcus sanguinicola TaxID=119206 RepID=A0A5N1GF40_9LACT|nr:MULTISPECIES: site-specific integrase [Aerococcus]KAA9298994.1 site-specific integrase [Aerococcus sanguinicola]MDK6370216.1 tyrosine-type recombinase/integrase [Aerococcus sp. UMB9870]MDK6680780.1 tyrosine-type recombinase/integrase [Aerococcus sp. UMB8608]MDK6686220.1 tyrosine-type recombinase/integrase [Aerococcus sp. UMB8623]MDK6939949.1 tyrosine-type recombinase/integrase [Aerococcus sp. UMB8487]
MARKRKIVFHEYFKEWFELYKLGAVRDVTLRKYDLTWRHLKRLAPDLTLDQLTKKNYQALLNQFAQSHEKQTTLDFHHLVKGAILEAYDEGLIDRDPTRKVVIKGVKGKNKKAKYLNQEDLHKLLNQLQLQTEISYDWLILLVAKTGLRFSEALGVTPDDFNFSQHMLSINKTWDYKKDEGGFVPTKNASSVRKLRLDWQLTLQFQQLIQGCPQEEPIFVQGRIHNSTVNQRLAKLCQQAEIPEITIHALRHTHASLLLYGGVSIASVAKRLGHANMATTQKTYLHIIQELEDKDNNKMMEILCQL